MGVSDPQFRELKQRVDRLYELLGVADDGVKVTNNGVRRKGRKMTDVPTDEAEGEPEQTDNRPRDEDGEQDVTQEPEPAEGSV